ncbi:MAG: hypothetical protein HYS26_03700 [Candidatus Kaiserbacteria bacterium]|nr:MAG: hypothetical protein HYS26_03700 [Candidatus Kaiserbacteria bacterium]
MTHALTAQAAQATLGPFQQAANRLKQFAVDCKVPNAAKIKFDGQLDLEWKKALEMIFIDNVLRRRFDYGVLREVRDSLVPIMGRWSFVGDIGQNAGHYQFLGLVRRMAQTEARLNIVRWNAQRDKLRAELHRLTDWRAINNLLSWD